jgi:hypothetical protein
VGPFLVLWTLFASASSVEAQAALAATSVTQGHAQPNARLTLRPAPGFEQLALKVARVLTLRGNTTVEIGDAPPAVLLEAVVAGQIAIAAGPTESSAYIVLGTGTGDSVATTIELAPDGENDARALALAIEALRDRAIERYENPPPEPVYADWTNEPNQADRSGSEPRAASHWSDGQGQPVAFAALAPMPMSEPAAPALPPTTTDESFSGESELPSAQQNGVGAQPIQPVSVPVASQRGQVSLASSYQLHGDPRDADEMLPRLEPSERTLKVKPRLYLSVYGGASSESRALRTGVSTGGGLCVRGQCLLLGLEYPLPIALEAGANDVRYRYPTFSLTFLSQPFVFGPFTPAVSVGVLSRIGHFERDMGRTDYVPGLDTDLAVRGTIEGAFEVVESIDVVAQAGLDYALDRWQYADAGRGSRVAPWLQAGIRVRPE